MDYAYGWVPSKPDFRDIIYSAPLVSIDDLPPQVDLSVDVGAPFNPVYSQGSLGSCGPQTATGDIVFAALKQQKIASVPMPSRLFIYYCTRQVMGTLPADSGVSNRDMLKALARYGWCDETLHPYSDQNTGSVNDPFRRIPSQSAFQSAAKRKIGLYQSVPQNLNTMLACLANGDPFIAGFSVYSSLESKQVEKTGIIPMPTRGESQRGGHDVLIVGYSKSTQLFKLRNSWGTDWGQAGYGYIPFAYLTNPQLSSDFWTITHSSLPDVTPPSPTPTPVPTPSPTPVPIPSPIGGNVMNFLMQMLLNMLKGQLEKWLQDGTLQKILEDLLKRLLDNNPKTIEELTTQVEATWASVQPK